MGTRREEILKKLAQEQGLDAKKDRWERIRSRIEKGTVTPIISNAIRIEQIFREDDATGEEDILSAYDQLTEDWASVIKYPLMDQRDLARVAQYYQVNVEKGEGGDGDEDEEHPRISYYDFLKSYLLSFPQTEPIYENIAEGLGKLKNRSLSEIANQLDYPRIPHTMEDPFHLLARLPFRMYLTTSQSDFLERALIAVDKQPKTQICFWRGEVLTKPAHRTDDSFIPTVDTPLVYHLYGLEEYPQTLVISEDDYINFLISVVENKNAQNPVIPSSVRMALGKSQLILLGYRLQDWDFRVLFRFIQNYERSDRGMVVQLSPYEKENLQSLKSYLKDYFNIRKFDIDWNNAYTVVKELWNDGKP